MFAARYVTSILYLFFLYKGHRSGRSFNNWVFDYIKEKKVGSVLKHDGLLFLLLSFEDNNDLESITVCLEVFDTDISKSKRLLKVRKRLVNAII